MCLYTNSSIKQYGLHIIAVDPITLLTFSFIWGLEEDLLKIKILMMPEQIRICWENSYISNKQIINCPWFLYCLEDIANLNACALVSPTALNTAAFMTLPI